MPESVSPLCTVYTCSPVVPCAGCAGAAGFAGSLVAFFENQIQKLPNTKGKTLVADVSSCFLSEPVDVTKYGVIYGGVQKNIGPAGVVIVIAREDLITDDVLPGTPTMLKWKTQADKDSLYNTPPCYGIYICGKVFKWLKKMGGLEEMQRRNIEKAKILYDFLDESKLFKGNCQKRKTVHPRIFRQSRFRRGIKLKPGMTLAVEPMINVGTKDVLWMDDEWTVVTEDKSLSAHYENTILITDGKPEILSLTEEEKKAGFLNLF